MVALGHRRGWVAEPEQDLVAVTDDDHVGEPDVTLRHTMIALGLTLAQLAPDKSSRARVFREHHQALVRAGHLGEAAASSREAVTLWRELAATDPDQHQPYIADAQYVLDAATQEAETSAGG
ncbi:hypothetical protein QLQ12_23775 [Actinoplanes sp. NEAU-A12]|uniref:Bacterial transcriptional activator domain-containing protein n=1 Tax=Actinoplanes sandaracinus TaxID=3045177 RepID=A0ABT6WPS4_9ACTN|nr:hypothetical protein [Actinoplanes sandaracinus]MDI6101645.1 hypothetical protein [Actinoplanes sandaracinus]